MGTPILTERAKEYILRAQEDIRDAVRETDDLITCAALGDVLKELDRILDWGEST